MSRPGNSTRCALRQNSREWHLDFLKNLQEHKDRKSGGIVFPLIFTLGPAERLCVHTDGIPYPKLPPPKKVVILSSRKNHFRLIFALCHLRIGIPTRSCDWESILRDRDYHRPWFFDSDSGSDKVTKLIRIHCRDELIDSPETRVEHSNQEIGPPKWSRNGL